MSSRLLATLLAGFFCVTIARAQTPAAINWKNTSGATELTDTTNWTNGTIGNDTTSTIGVFGNAVVAQPTLGNASFSLAGVRFDTGSGSYTLSATGGNTLTLGASGVENLNTTATEIISAPLTFATGSTISNAGTLTISGAVTNNTTGLILTGTGTAGTISGVISGSGPLSMTGGRWALTGTNTYTGATSITGGTLAINSDGALGNAPATPTSGALTFDNNAALEATQTLTLNSNRGVQLNAGGGTINTDAAVTLTYNGAIAGTGNLNKTGTGTLTLGGINNYSGVTTVQVGVLQDSAAGAFSSNSQLAVASGASVNVTQYESVHGINDVAGAGGSIAITTGSQLTLNAGGPGGFSGVISGGGALALNGASPFVQVLTGNSTYTGGTMIAGNMSLQLGIGTAGVGGTSGSIPSGNIVDNGSLEFFHSDNTSSGGISGTGQVQQLGSGTLTLTGTNTYSGGTFIAAGTVTGALPSSTAVLMNGGNFTVASSQAIGGLGDWNFSGTATGNVSIASGAALTIGSNGSTFSGNITGPGQLVIGSGANQTVAGNVALTNGVTVNSGGTLQIGKGGTSGAVTGTITDNGRLAFNRSDSISYANLTGSGGIQQMGTGTLVLGGSNTYTGMTELQTGTLADSGTGSLSPNSVVNFTGSGATLNINSAETIAGLQDGSSVSTNLVTIGSGATLTVNSHGGNLYTGQITGLGGLTLAGGSQILSGSNNTYSGGTQINGGTLTVANLSGSATGTGSIAVANGAALQLGNNGSGGMVSGDIANNGSVVFASADSTATYGGVISGTGGLRVGIGGSGILTLTGANTYAGPTFINTGTLRIGAANALPSGTFVAMNSGSTLDLAASQTLNRMGNAGGATINIEGGATLTLSPGAGQYGGTINGTLTGPGAFAFSGVSGTAATLNGNNTYSGGTTVSSGTLLVGSNSALGTGTVTLQSNSGLELGKSVNSDVTLANNMSLADGVTLASDQNDSSLILTGTITTPTSAATLHIGNVVQINGTLKAASGSTVLTIDSDPNSFGHVVFNNSSIDHSITGITVNSAGIDFGSAASVPAAGTLSIKGASGYVGLVSVSGSAPTVSSVVALLDPSFTGVLGFDTAGNHVPLGQFNDNINLSSFGANVTLGSASGAVLNGTITPSSSGYLFGNGGGGLVVTSPLTGAFGLTVASVSTIPDNGLITILRGANTFSGSVSVTNSALILDSAGALPTGRPVSLGVHGYAGYTEAFTGAASFADFANLVAAGGYTGTSVIGVDSNGFISSEITSGTAGSARSLSDTINLGSFGSVYLGTSTRAVLNGPIYAPAQGGANGTLSLVAINDGQLTVNSDLVAGQVNSVVAGLGNAKGSVILNGRNTYAGGTTLQSGNLIVNSSDVSAAGIASGSLGTGTLTVAANAKNPTLASGNRFSFISNAISLGGPLQLGFPTAASGDAIPAGVTGNSLFLDGAISDLAGAVGSLQTYGTVGFGAANTFSGGVTVNEGQVYLDNDAALGTGTLTLSPGFTSAANMITIGSPESRTLGNNIVYSGASRGIVNFGVAGTLTLNGSVTLNNDVEFSSYQYPVYFNGPITGVGRLINYGGAPLTLSGSNSYAGGTESQWGAIIFSTAASMPASPGINAFTATGTGYIGIGFAPANPADLQTTFLNRFNKPASSGTIGFDGGNTFAGAVDLTGFSSSARLGSASSAILSGTITPQSNTYNFGGGGGHLEIDSALVDAAVTAPRGVNVTSGTGTAPLTVRLTGANTFSGGATVVNSGLVFGTGALPASGTLTPLVSAYIGTEDSAFATTPSNFVNRFAATSSGAIVGFDSLTVTGGVSLANFTSTSDPQIAIGTSTSATISGAITLPSAQMAYRLVGYKGGQLTVQSQLTDAGAVVRSVIIGDASNPATFSNPAVAGSPLSNVILTGANTYTGGTTLAAGVLNVGNDSALGTGPLTIASNSTNDGRALALYAFGGARTLSNAIALGSDNLDIGGANDLTLTGNITGSGELHKVGTGMLTLSGANTNSGDIYLKGGNITFTTGTSVGTGALEMGLLGSSATFLDSSTVNGIYADLSGDTINLTAGKTLTINQTFDSQYEGTFAGTTAGLNFTGSGYRLHLDGASTYTGPTTIESGVAVIAGNNNAFGAGTNVVTVNGGKLATISGVVVANPITLTSGAIGGVGTFKAAAGSTGFNIGSGITISPGLGGPGTVAFDGSLISTSVLILSNGGTYRWELLDAASGSGFDTITVNGTVNVTATSAHPFTFSINSIAADGSNALAANFDPTRAYSWSVLTASSITGFTNANQFALDTSGFGNSNSGVFSLSLNGTNTALMLNFSPVPEPSTYALMIAGLGILGLAARRRRRL